MTEYLYGTVICTGQVGGRPRLFRKFYRYLDAHVARDEYECARAIFEQGIATPRPLRLVEHSTFGSGIEFAWEKLDPIDEPPPALVTQNLQALVAQFHRAAPPTACQAWPALVASEYEPELARAQTWCRNHGEPAAVQALDLAAHTFNNLYADGVVHGDLSPANLGYVGQHLYCLDFRHVSTGPRDWDLGYFLCHLAPDEPLAQAILEGRAEVIVIDLAIVAAAIKLGRRLRRGDDPAPGWQRLFAWIDEKQRRPVLPRPTEHAQVSGGASMQLALAYLRHGLLDRSQSMLTAIARASSPQGHAAQLNLAAILHVQGHFDAARSAYETLLPDVESRHVAGVLLNLSILHLQLRDPDTARLWLDRAQQQAPNNVAVDVAKLAWYHSFRQYGNGIDAFEQVRAAYPQHALTAVICNTGANLYGAAGQWEQARACWKAAQIFDPDYSNAATNEALASIDRISHAELFGDLHRSFRRRTDYFPPRELAPRTAYQRIPSKRLRIGIVSSKIRRGKTGYLLRALLSTLDPERFQILVYDNAVCIDRFSAPLQSMAAEWIGVFGWSASALARRIQSDQVDVLLDLDGHSPRNFALAFWLQPAPLQLGLAALAAPAVLDDLPALKEAVSDLYALDEPVNLLATSVGTRLRLAYVGDADKLDAETLSVLCQVLQQIPSASLTLKSLDFDDSKLAERVRQHFTDAAIDAARLRFVGFIKGHRQHLAFHQDVDVLIDALNRSSQIALYEALQHGVPVLALERNAHTVTRGAQQLRTLGLPHFVAKDVNALVALCRAAADNQRMATWRLAAREALARHQQALSERGRQLGAHITAISQASAPRVDWPRFGDEDRYEIECFDGDASWLLLTSCFGDHVLLSLFDA